MKYLQHEYYYPLKIVTFAADKAKIRKHSNGHLHIKVVCRTVKGLITIVTGKIRKARFIAIQLQCCQVMYRNKSYKMNK